MGSSLIEQMLVGHRTQWRLRPKPLISLNSLAPFFKHYSVWCLILWLYWKFPFIWSLIISDWINVVSPFPVFFFIPSCCRLMSGHLLWPLLMFQLILLVCYRLQITFQPSVLWLLLPRLLKEYESSHDKTNKMACAPSEDSLSTWRKLGSLATHRAHSEDSDQTGRLVLLVLSWGGPIMVMLLASNQSYSCKCLSSTLSICKGFICLLFVCETLS